MDHKPNPEKQHVPIPAENADKGPFRVPPAAEEPVKAHAEPRVPTAEETKKKIDEVEDDDRFQASDN